MNRIALLALLLAGCVTTAPRGPEITEGTENSVTINWSRSNSGATGAQGVADAHCAKYGRRAQFVGKITDFDLSYSCVK